MEYHVLPHHRAKEQFYVGPCNEKVTFCVRVTDKLGNPQQIAPKAITVELGGILLKDFDDKEGWCHYNYTVQIPMPGLYLLRVISGTECVEERMIRIFDKNAEADPNSLPRNVKGCGAQAFKRQHQQGGASKEGFGDFTKFKAWAAAGNWQFFGHHYNHYDWWMFPVQEPGMYPEYAVGLFEVHELKQDAQFMSDYREGVALLLLSWGWDVHNSRWVDNPSPSQKWDNWNVRLGKAAASLALFGEMQLFNSLRKYLIALLKKQRDGDSTINPITTHFGFNPCTILGVPNNQ